MLLRVLDVPKVYCHQYKKFVYKSINCTILNIVTVLHLILSGLFLFGIWNGYKCTQCFQCLSVQFILIWMFNSAYLIYSLSSLPPLKVLFLTETQFLHLLIKFLTVVSWVTPTARNITIMITIILTADALVSPTGLSRSSCRPWGGPTRVSYPWSGPGRWWAAAAGLSSAPPWCRGPWGSGHHSHLQSADNRQRREVLEAYFGISSEKTTLQQFSVE